ncbi:rRNA biogenesis protein RRP36 [Daldinia childiae]|uniref:rRNA biogenesis protein RRP36 n=1 Tax=Daldinia childiae TaxID=326645 RepID=UPI001444A128|nr:rRNA biogenesis protein RRP36 [Daldinia childiae]KAF3064802.1 rRNA biogenesis protein RRP36 [Daldinia childiae]
MERMTTSKRKAPLASLQRRVRARRDEPEEIPSDQSQGEESSEDEGSEGQSDEQEDDDESGSSSEEDEDEVEDPSTAASQISFGALAKAQASLPGTRRGKGRKSQDDEDEDEEDNDKRHKDPRSESKTKISTPHRTSKHAPTEQTSKRQVTRRREVIATHKPVARDPRFSAAVQGRPVDEERLQRAYGFLDEYRDSEIAQLRAAARKTKDATAKEELKRALSSMEGKKKAQQAREAERKLLEEHRRREKELVKQGKKPFYLKRSEQKKQLLVDRFAGLKGKQVDRVIERRRKKLASKERRDMPMERRERS